VVAYWCEKSCPRGSPFLVDPIPSSQEEPCPYANHPNLRPGCSLPRAGMRSIPPDRARNDRGNPRIKRVTRAIYLLTAPLKNVNSCCVYPPKGHRSGAFMGPLYLLTPRPSILYDYVQLCPSPDRSQELPQRGSLQCRKRQKAHSSKCLSVFACSLLFW